MRKKILLLTLGLCVMMGCASADNQVLPTATSTPMPTATSTPMPTSTNTPVPTATNTPVPTATSTPMPTATSTPMPTATNTPVPTATSTPVPTATNTPVPTATNTPVPTATSTPVPTATSTPMPTATSTPVPTATPRPMPEIDYTIFEFDYGTLYVNYDLKVYDTPHAMGQYLGVIERGTAVQVTARCIETDWMRLEYNGMVGYAPSAEGSIVYISKKLREIDVSSKSVMIPDVSMMTEEEAIKTLEALGLKVYSIDRAYQRSSLDYPVGAICGTMPAYGSVVMKGSQVQLCLAYAPWEFELESMMLPDETTTNVKIVKRTVLGRHYPRVEQYGDDSPVVAVYSEEVELEYSDGTVLQVMYWMEDAEIENVTQVKVVNFANSEAAKNPFLTQECYDALNMKYAATYPLGYTQLFNGGAKRTPYGNWEYIVEFGTDGSYVVMKKGNLIFTDHPKYDAVDPIFTPLYWASETTKTTSPVESYQSSGNTYETYADSTQVMYLKNGSRIDVTNKDGSGYSVFYKVYSSGIKYLTKVTFYDANKEELYTIYYRQIVEPYMYVWYRYVGENQVQIVNSDGTPVERFKDMVFDAEAAFTNNNGGGAQSNMLKIRHFYKGDVEINLDTYKFTVKTIEGKLIELYQHEFPLEDY